MLARTPDDDGLTALSPARRALAEHLRTIAGLEADVARTGLPVERLRVQLREQIDALAAIEGELARIESDHASAIAAAAREGRTDGIAAPPTRQKLQAARITAQQTKTAVEAALRQCEAEHDPAVSALREAMPPLDQLALSVLIEEHAAALDRRGQKLREFLDAEAELLGIGTAMGEHGNQLYGRIPEQGRPWLAAAEHVGNAYRHLPPADTAPRDVTAAASRWTSLLARLSSDATAR